MALALPQALTHAAPHQTPTAKTGALLKAPANAVPPKVGVADATPKTKFQALLDQLAQAVKPQTEPTDKTKGAKAKTEALVEKPKDPKKVEGKEPKEAKDHKADGLEVALAALVVAPPKTETLVKPKVEAETSSALEKTKPSLRDRRTGAELGVPAPVTAAAAEVARAQAQQNSPKSERSEEKQRIFVVDRRTDPKEKEKLKLPGAEAAAQQPITAAEFQVQQTKNNETKTAAEVQVTFQSVSGKAKEGFDLKSQNTPVSPRDAATFQQYLVEKGYGQLVDQARIVLKDQNAGEIRMTLYPESLGKVKVSLDLSDNTLAGRIFVENETVKEVFQTNMDGLMEAFKEGGWDNMSLEVSVGNGSGGNQAGDHQPPAASQARDYGRQVSQTGPEVPSNRIGSWNDRQINLTA